MKIYEEVDLGLAAGATEPISVVDAKSWAIIDTNLDDSVIESIIVSARIMAETFLSRDIISKDRKVFVDYPVEDDGIYSVCLTYPAKTSTLVVVSDGDTLIADTDYKVIGIQNHIIEFSASYPDITITYESEPIVSLPEFNSAESAVKSLIEQIYDNRGNLEGDSDIRILDSNIKRMLMPLKRIYL
ncbi:MAG: hypothetical protein JKX82_07845 [Oleispira sp.]|nr:hypothetical protein [Oleispira sp.]